MSLTAKMTKNDRRYPNNHARPHNVVLYICYEKPKKQHELVIYPRNSKVSESYLITGNISTIITRFINEGKSTISFKEPPMDLMLIANKKEMMTFLETLKAVLTNTPGPITGVITDRAATVKKAAQTTRLPKTLRIVNTKDIPSNFPRTLEHLEMSSLGISKILPQTLTLANLVDLDLSYNKLTDLPNLDTLNSLVKLNLSMNKFNRSSWSWLRGTISERLLDLDLSHNELIVFPLFLHRASKLHTLNLINNRIRRMPSYLWTMTSLKNLALSNNRIIVIPFSINSMRLKTFRIEDNQPLCDIVVPSSKFHMNVNSLFNIAADVVKRSYLNLAKLRLPVDVELYVANFGFKCAKCPKYQYSDWVYVERSMVEFTSRAEVFYSRGKVNHVVALFFCDACQVRRGCWGAFDYVVGIEVYGSDEPMEMCRKYRAEEVVEGGVIV